MKTPNGWWQGASRIASGEKLGEIPMPGHPPEDTNDWYLSKRRKLSFGVRQRPDDCGDTMLIIGSDSTMTPRCPTKTEVEAVLRDFGLSLETVELWLVDNHWTLLKTKVEL